MDGNEEKRTEQTLNPVEKDMLAEFRNSRTEHTLDELIKAGNVGAECYADNASYERQTTVYGYRTESEEPKVFMERDGNETTLVLGNQIMTATTDEELKRLEFELFDWALDEGYFD